MPKGRLARLRRRANTAALAAAGLAGAALRSVPGLTGAAAVSYGVFQVYQPAGWIVAGVFLIMVDRRVP